MSQKSRTYNSIINSLFGIVASFITVALNFAVRVVLVRQLGEEINGINSLFQSITSFMALMEMGVSTAMIIHLYEPVKNEDRNAISGIMNFYKEVYCYVAVAFLVVGIIIDFFFLDKLVTTTIPLSKVRVFFIFFIATFVLNYLTYYKRSILFAEQKNRISTGVTAATEIVFRGLQIVTLILLHDYIVFLILLMVEKVVNNTICQIYVEKHHPYLRHNTIKISSEKKKAIFATVKPLMVNQTATTLQNASTAILISILLGNVSIVGYYGVYQLIISVVSILFSQIGGSFGTSFGNLAVENNHEHMRDVFKKAAFIFDLVACFCATLFIACADDFVYMFFGQNFILSKASVVLLTIQMLVGLLALPAISVQNAMGLHRYDATAMVFQAIVSVLLGYAFGKLWGMPGIIMGSIIPIFAIVLLRKGIIISRVAFSLSWKEFIKGLSLDVLRISIALTLTYIICELIVIEPRFVADMPVFNAPSHVASNEIA